MHVDENICNDSDSYKSTHWLQYPKNAKFINSYLESRCDSTNSFNVFYGLQMVLMEHLVGEVITAEKIDEAENNSIEEFGHNYFNRGGFEYILNEHKGKLPIEITAVPEGSIIPSRNILMQIINTDENCAWLPNFLETILLHVWYPTTVCTNSYKLRMLIDSYAQKSGTRVTPFHVHDFGMRGVSSLQSSGIAGSAHLVNFLGSDNTVGRRYAKAFYNADGKDLSSTIYAAEHSTVISYGRDKELESYNNIIDSAPPELPISIVSDSYDHLHAVKEYFGDSLKEKIMSRTGKVVIRPNSGNGVEISDKTIELLGKSYGFIENSGGYKTLNPHVGVIYGDRVSEDAIKCILDRLVNRKKYSTDNIVFGIGKELTQAVNCDDYKFAFKASTIMVNDEWRDIKKTVVTDHTKASKAGRMKLIIDENGNYKTIPLDDEGNDVLKTIFKNGKITKKVTFDEIRKRSGWFDYY